MPFVIALLFTTMAMASADVRSDHSRPALWWDVSTVSDTSARVDLTSWFSPALRSDASVEQDVTFRWEGVPAGWQVSTPPNVTMRGWDVEWIELTVVPDASRSGATLTLVASSPVMEARLTVLVEMWMDFEIEVIHADLYREVAGEVTASFRGNRVPVADAPLTIFEFREGSNVAQRIQGTTDGSGSFIFYFEHDVHGANQLGEHELWARLDLQGPERWASANYEITPLWIRVCNDGDGGYRVTQEQCGANGSVP